VSWLEEDCKDILPKESQEHLMLLRNRTERMVGLLRDLLEYSKIGRSKYDVEKIYLQPFVEDIFTLLGDREGFTCRSPNVPLILPKVPLEVVIRNLITNAIKHHDKGKGIITIKAEQDNEFYFFQIIDDGPGISPAFQAKSLEMFQTLQSKDTLDSSGMGLAIVKKTIERYGGSLSIVSDGKRGTSVHIKWPQRPLPEF
jgi:signal transduction histidine kinase